MLTFSELLSFWDQKALNPPSSGGANGFAVYSRCLVAVPIVLVVAFEMQTVYNVRGVAEQRRQVSKRQIVAARDRTSSGKSKQV
jgi:hypothetical protein